MIDFRNITITGAGAAAAVGVSGGLGTVGIWNLVGDGVAKADPFAIISGALLFAGLVSAELYAVKMLVERDKRRAEAGGATNKSAMAMAIYVVAEGINFMAGGFGVMTINDRLVAAQTAPLAEAYAKAAAEHAAAKDALHRFDEQTKKGLADYERDIDADRKNFAGAVTARGGKVDKKQAYAAQRESERKAYAEAVVANDAAERAAKGKLDHGPKGMSWLQEYGLALALILFKGPGVWAATAGGGEARRRRSLFGGKPENVDVRDVLSKQQKAAIRAMGQRERDELRAIARSVATMCQQATRCAAAGAA